MSRDLSQPFVGAWIAGGLGNQLFQFAAAYAYSLRTGAALLLDINFFHHSAKDRDYALAKLGINEKKWPWVTPTSGARWSISPRHMAGVLRTKIRQWSLRYKVISEKRYDYDEALSLMNSSIYLHGYWQSPLYFADAASQLRDSVKLAPLVKATSPRAESIRNTMSVAIHVRRGDYATQHSDTFGLIPYEYYAYAASLLRRSVENPQFFIFSDDYSSARDMFGDWPDATVCSALSPEEDLAQIAFCKHQIIANSTFSWWGAWLNSNSEKIVIAPKQWAQKKVLLSRYIFDLFPQNWLLL